GGDTGGGKADVFISEYIEGSSYNKAIELFNPTSQEIDLSADNYKLGRFSNGGTTASLITLEGVIAAQGTYVIANSRASDAIKALANMETGSLSHNGDDAYVLYKNDEVVDSFGRIGEDPGSAWGSGSFSTKDNSLQRNSTVVIGDTVIDDEFDPATQWTGSGKDNIDDLGQHSIINPEIFISEYIEGSSYNKALELYNPAVIDVDLTAANYQLGRFTNGSTVPTMFAIEGNIPAKGTFVIANTGAASQILAVANQLTNNISHNGDDAYVLYKDGVVIDSLGRVGEDPGSEWGSGSESTKDNTLVRKASVTTGDTIIDDIFAPELEWNGFAKNTFDFLGSHEMDDGSIEPPDNLGVCADPATLIHQVQGTVDISPLLNETHIIEGVVTVVLSNSSGFFIQEEAAEQDGDPVTSEGLFVLNNTNTIIPTQGDVVRVLGTVSEYFGKTQLEAKQDLLQCGTTTFAAINLALPFSSAQAKESLEGMFVSISEDLTVTNNYYLGRYGEVTLSNGRLYVPTNLHQPGSTEVTDLAAQNALNKITLDDGVNGQNPDNIIYPTGGLTALNTLRTGDTVTSLNGVVDFSFGLYRIIPNEQPAFNFINSRTAAPELSAEGNLKIASFNVLNYFNGDGIGGGYPTSRGADNAEEFVRQRDKIISAITIMNADIIGILEMENDGFGENSAIQDLVNGLNAVAPSDVNYSFVNPHIPADEETGIEILGGDHIKVAMIYNNKKVTEVGTAAYVTQFPFEYHNRPPMAQSFALTENDEKITVAINHFRSKGCSTSGGVENEDKLDGQGCYNLRRVQAAQATVEWLAQFPTGIDDEDILIIGDLNAYSKEDPVTTIQAAGYTNLTHKFSGDFGYSYSYQGETGTLDHALASASLTAQVLDLTEWHINSDEPVIIDYNTEYKTPDKLSSLYNSDAYRASDHDPVVLSINLSPALLKGDWDNDGDVDINDVRAFMVALQTRLPIDMAFDLNSDGTVNILDIRFMMTLCTRERCAA
ncbi:MAG: ExeM/NucH family extracellular endonuclease, partial [Colwellia sp.]|nr:ExeM/NucH family extracellular endonuclease [Colwellia sp.]